MSGYGGHTHPASDIRDVAGAYHSHPGFDDALRRIEGLEDAVRTLYGEVRELAGKVNAATGRRS